MKITSRNKKPLTILLMIALSIPLASILTAFPAPVQAQTLTNTIATVTPNSTGPLAVGSFFDIFVEIDNVAGLTGVAGLVHYDQTILAADSASAGTGTGVNNGSICAAAGACESADPGTANNGLGQVTWETFLVGYGSGFSGSGTIIKIHFKVIAKGTSVLQLESNPPNSVSDPKTGETDELAMTDTLFNQISHHEIDGSFFVNPQKTAPTAVLSCLDSTSAKIPCPSSVPVKQKLVFDGSQSHDTNVPAQQIIKYNFTVNGAVLQSGAQTSFSFSQTTPASYKVCLVVTNFSGLSSAPACDTVAVTAIKSAPTAVLNPTGPLTVDVKTKTTFDGSHSVDNSNPLQSIVKYNFTVNGAVVQSGSSASFSFSTGTPGPYNVCLIVVNQSGLPSTPACTPVTVNAVKNPPTAMLQCDTTSGPGPCPAKITIGGTVTFDGTGSTDNSNPVQHITNYNFTVNGVVAQSGPSAIFIFTPTTTGSDTVCLKVTNDSGVTSSFAACTDLRVNPPAKSAPVAVLSCLDSTGAKITCPAKINVKQAVTFDGSQSHDTNTPSQQLTTYAFSVNGTVDQSGTSTTFMFSTGTPAVYNICLIVTNISLLPSQPACTLITVNAIKAAPRPVLQCDTATGLGPCPTKVDAKTKITFDGSGSTDLSNPVQRITNYAFSVNNAVAQTGASATFSFSTGTPGNYNICLVVTNESGMSSPTACTSVMVNAIKNAPTAVLTPSGSVKIAAGSTQVFDGGQSHDNSNPVQHITNYNFTVNGSIAQSGSSSTFSFTPTATGSDTVCLTVTNDSGLQSTAVCTQVTVNPAKAAVTATLVPPKAGAAYTNASATFIIRISGGTPPFTCVVSFGDGTPSQSISSCTDGQTVSHTYMTAGTFTATLTVTGANPQDHSTSNATIDVQPAPLFIHGKLSWKHHLTSATQMFSAKISNPSKFTVQVTVHLDITKPDGTTDTVDGGPFTLGPGVSNTSATFTYNASMLGKYCFTATVHYTVDVNGDGITDITGVGPNSKSGCFNRV